MTAPAQSLAALDAVRLADAQAWAERAIGLSDPNPRVGCVIGLPDGTVLGAGHTQAAGDAHAEVMALRDVARHGGDARGATAWVTLEPCSHHGRTPPCCDALIAAGIARVVVAAGDPNPAVNGRGLERLRAAGMEVLLAGGEAAAATHELNIGFFSRMEGRGPWVRAKAATSLDGRTALPDGQSQWITGAAARRDGHAWRRRAGVVLTGIGTVLADDPRMDVRLVPTARQPRRAVVDTHLRLPNEAKLLAQPGLIVYTAKPTSDRAAQALQDRGAEIVSVPLTSGGVDLRRVVADLTARAVNEVHVEAGARLNGSLLQASAVDEWLIYMAPSLLGEGMPMAEILPPSALGAAIKLSWHEALLLGSDLRLRLRRDTAKLAQADTRAQS